MWRDASVYPAPPTHTQTPAHRRSAGIAPPPRRLRSRAQPAQQQLKRQRFTEAGAQHATCSRTQPACRGRPSVMQGTSNPLRCHIPRAGLQERKKWWGAQRARRRVVRGCKKRPRSEVKRVGEQRVHVVMFT